MTRLEGRSGPDGLHVVGDLVTDVIMRRTSAGPWREVDRG